MLRLLLVLFVFSIPLSCVSWSPEDQKKAPEINSSTSLEERVRVAIDFGGKSIDSSRKIMEAKGDTSAVESLLLEIIPKDIEKWTEPQLIHAVQLYELTRPSDTSKLFTLLTKYDDSIKLKLGWRLAGVGTSSNMAASIDGVLTRDMNNMEKHLIPEMAKSIGIHRIKNLYTVLRVGLFKKGDVAFAQAMIKIKPLDAANDFMSYLQQASSEELRQRTLVSVNSYTCSVILSHLEMTPISASNAHIMKLFEFAVSRNIVLAKGAREVIESWAPTLGEALSEELARADVYVQIAFIEGTRREPSPNIKGILERLKNTTTHAAVLDELANLRL
ncbi:MAG: hypothetical protein WCI18_07285 [Pseudomonadota bacterium]